MSERRFAVFDIDGTLIRWQLYHAIADKLASLGYIDQNDFQDIRDARMAWKRREHDESFRDYELRLVELYTNVLLKITVDQFKQAADEVFAEYKDQVYTYTRGLIKDLKKEEYLIFAISGSQEEIVKKMAAWYGFDAIAARIDEQSGGKFTGKSTTPIFAKDAALKKLVGQNNAGWSGSYGFGDSYSDIKMLELVENPVAFNPEKRLFDYARKKGWKIVIERKNMVYVLENIKGKYELAETKE